ncbi:hypothetical protein M8542_32510 [Amycolatopsis sp. OK19-0408]|uniref:Uncharacterized protein n=1 Tax=Amycolatopsis iheyensis TaxID=2945988 RepID=A0A9X2NMF8_9PSEU|nr:hypothetical protein [Amycolatopsis iheyensis]MCR6487560.1 hypothetical protein [Amycolatopsis iheyensis]
MTARRRLALAAVLGSSAVLAALSARPPRDHRPPPPSPVPPKAPETPAPEPPQFLAKVYRQLVLAALLVVSAAVSVFAAHEELSGSGDGITTTGILGLIAALVLLGWWRGTWDVHYDTGLLAFCAVGLILVLCAGPAVVTEMVLAHRGTPVTVEAVRTGADDYTLVVPGGSTPLRGLLHTSGQLPATFTALVDPEGFVRPMRAADVSPAFPAAVLLGGAGVLGVTVLGSGFPLGQGRRRVA